MSAPGAPTRRAGAEAAAGTAEYYDSFWKTLANSAEHPTNIYRYELIAEALGELCPEIGCLVDFGCGNAAILDYLSRRIAIRRYVGIDVSPDIVDACDRLERPGCEFHRADLQQPIDAAFAGIADAAVCCEVIEHLPEYRPLLANLASVLREGGHLVLTTPSGTLGRLERELFGHVRHFDRDALAAEIEGFGFRVVHKTNCGFPMLDLERRVASLFLDRVSRSLENDFERSRLFRAMRLVIGAGMRLSSRRFGCQLVITARREGA